MSFTSFSRNQTKWGRSDWSRPSITSIATEETKTEAPTVQISKRSFSVFGNKQKFTTMDTTSETSSITPSGIISHSSSNNNNPSISPAATTNTNNTNTTAPKSRKFELHLSSKTVNNKKSLISTAVANQKERENNPTTCLDSLPRKKSAVKFDPVFLERVCLFRESQTPIELKEAHDRRLKNPPFRLTCPHWPHVQTTHYQTKNILLDKKTFTVMPDNRRIKGQLMIRNLALDKSVSIRYTFDHWTTAMDMDAVFFGPNPKHVVFDIYEFIMDVESNLSDHGELRCKLEFSIRFTASEEDYWDDNNGQHYQIRIISDPMNDPWATEKKQERKELKQKDSISDDEDSDDDYDDYDGNDEYDEEQQANEKHNSFTNALKGYKHAKPFHLNKRQPWLGTRYDFGQSLSMAKRAHHEANSKTTLAQEGSASDPFFVKPIIIKPTSPPPIMESNEPFYFSMPTSIHSATSSFENLPNNSNISSKPVKSSSLNTFGSTYGPTNNNSAIKLDSQEPVKISAPSYTTFGKNSTFATTNVHVSEESTSPISIPSYSKPVYVLSSFIAPPSPKTSPTITPAKIAKTSPLPPSSSTVRARPAFRTYKTSTFNTPTTTTIFTHPQNRNSTTTTSPSDDGKANSDQRPLDMDSSYYLDLVQKYCFYHSKHSINNDEAPSSPYGGQPTISSSP